MAYYDFFFDILCYDFFKKTQCVNKCCWKHADHKAEDLTLVFFSPQISSGLPDLSDEVSGGHGGQGFWERSGHPTEQRRILLTSGRETWTSTVWWCPVCTEGYVHSLVSSFLKTQLASHRQQEPGCKNTRFGLKNRGQHKFFIVSWS